MAVKMEEKLHKDNKLKKHYYIEFLRIYAIFFVIFCHTEGHELIMQCQGRSFRYLLYMLFVNSYNIAISSFFAIAGALLLPKKEEPISIIWKKRISRIFISLLFFSLVYYLSAVKSGAVSFGILPFLAGLLEQGWAIPLWYMYAYISFLICLPFLRSMAQNLKDREFVYLFVLAAMFGIIKPVIQDIVFHNNHYLHESLNIGWLLETMVLYPLMGYFIHNRLTGKQAEKLIVPLWTACVIAVGSSWVLNIRAGGNQQMITAEYGYHNYYIFLYCFTAYISLHYLEEKLHGKAIPGKKWLQKFLLSLGGCTFGIYLWHVLFIDKLQFLKRWKVILFEHLSWMDDMAVALIWCTIILLLSYALTWCMKKIPLLKNLV